MTVSEDHVVVRYSVRAFIDNLADPFEDLYNLLLPRPALLRWRAQTHLDIYQLLLLICYSQRL